MRSSYTVFLSLYILFLLLLFFTKVYKHGPWQQPHDVTPQKDVKPPDRTPDTQIEFHDVTPDNQTEVHNVTDHIEPPNVTPQTRIEKALVVVTKTQDDCHWMNDVDNSWTKYTYLVTEDSLPSKSNLTLSVPIVRTPFFPPTFIPNPKKCLARSKQSLDLAAHQLHKHVSYLRPLSFKKDTLTASSTKRSQNKANEAMRYLSFLIDNYDHLPDIIAFRHGHQASWHQSADAAAEVNHLNLTTVRTRGYQNFRCTLNDGTKDHDCPADGKDHLTHEGKPYWESVEPELQSAFADLWDNWFGGPRPEYLMSACCAQFVVTGEAVRGRSRDEYVKFRRFLIDTELEDYFSGRVFERSWHVVFGKEPVHCETEEECRCLVYTGPLGCRHGWW